MEQQEIHGAISAIMDAIKRQGTSPSSIKNIQSAYNVFERYLVDNGITEIDENICLKYMHFKTGFKYERFECIVANVKANYHMRPLLLLLRYLKDGQFNGNVRRRMPPFMCPAYFSAEYEAFCRELIFRGYSNATKDNNMQKVQSLISYLTTRGVLSSTDITIQIIEEYMRTLKGKAVRYIGAYLSVFRNFFSFLYNRGYIENDLTPMLPKVRASHNAFIPYTWSKDDIQKLIGAIDRNDPKGKRDYAILLIAVRLGLRIGDIRSLKKSSINWERKTINLIMSKTGQPIELPLIKDIGWAIIDYLKNGRPTSTSDRLFIRHMAPYNAFGNCYSFNIDLHRYIIKAGLNIPDGKRCGMHSLRSTLAGSLLGNKVSLPIISETLGHQSVNTTSIYLKIDIEGLRKCAMDPEEVFAL